MKNGVSRKIRSFDGFRGPCVSVGAAQFNFGVCVRSLVFIIRLFFIFAFVVFVFVSRHHHILDLNPSSNWLMLYYELCYCSSVYLDPSFHCLKCMHTDSIDHQIFTSIYFLNFSSTTMIALFLRLIAYIERAFSLSCCCCCSSLSSKYNFRWRMLHALTVTAQWQRANEQQQQQQQQRTTEWRRSRMKKKLS